MPTLIRNYANLVNSPSHSLVPPLGDVVVVALCHALLSSDEMSCLPTQRLRLHDPHQNRKVVKIIYRHFYLLKSTHLSSSYIEMLVYPWHSLRKPWTLSKSWRELWWLYMYLTSTTLESDQEKDVLWFVSQERTFASPAVWLSIIVCWQIWMVIMFVCQRTWWTWGLYIIWVLCWRLSSPKMAWCI